MKSLRLGIGSFAPELFAIDRTVDDAARGVAMGTRAVRDDTFGNGLAADVDTLARLAFNAGLAAALLDPPITDPEAFYGGLIEGIQETYCGLNARNSGGAQRPSCGQGRT